MISRRLVRIKALQSLYSLELKEDSDINKQLGLLEEQMLNTWRTYLCLLHFPAGFRNFLDLIISNEKEKFFPNQENIRKASFFHGKDTIDLLEDALKTEEKELSWIDWNSCELHIEKIREELVAQETLQDYIIFDTPSFEQNRDFLEWFYDFLFTESEHFQEMMEEVYPVWNDDSEVLYKALRNTISQWKPGTLPVLAQPGEEELEMGMRLLKYSFTEKENIDREIISASANWDRERIALIDMLLMRMAISEFLHFPLVPTKVTINEYLDIAKEYSTPQSSKFINGIIDKVRIQLQEENRISKQGRGLRDK